MRRVAVLMCAAIVAGCGGATSESTPSTSSGPAPQATNATTTIPATTVITSAPTSPPDTATTSPAEPSGGTSPDSSFVPPTTPTPTTTPTTVPWPADVTVGPPTPDLLDALPSEGIPWETVGPDWLALDFPRPAHYTDPPTLDQRGLYLVDPDNRIYAISALPSDGTDLISVSWTGRFALLQGPYAMGLPIGVLDLETTVYRTILHDSLDLEIVTFTTAGDGLWIYDIDPGSEPGALRTFRVSTIDFATRTARIVFEQSVDENTGSDYYNWWINSRGGVAEMPNGEIVTATPTGVWIGDPEGQEFRRLDVPDAACSVVRPWNATEVLMECELPCAEECGEVWSGLWLVPTDGRASAPLAIPERFNVAYYDAAPLDGGLAISAVFGPGECNHHVVLVEAESIDVWTPPIAAVDCMEYVVGVRNGAVLIDAGNPYASSDPRALFEVSGTGTTLVDIPDGRVHQLEP